jgi:hypothetical protein
VGFMREKGWRGGAREEDGGGGGVAE